jgi:HAD superfamily hydrolase (TIGR01509 family)
VNPHDLEHDDRRTQPSWHGSCSLVERVISTVLLDVDGTLVDSNDAHAHAWVAAFREAGLHVEFDRVRRCIGMGADKLLPEVCNVHEDDPLGRQVSRRRGEIFSKEWLPRLQPQPDAARLLAALQDRGFTLVAASSAKRQELLPLLEIAGGRWLMDEQTSSDDAEASKPDPDIIQAALERAQARASEAIMIGDTPYDIEAAARAGVATIAFRCGGWDDVRLRDALAIYDGPSDLLAQLDSSLLAG